MARCRDAFGIGGLSIIVGVWGAGNAVNFLETVVFQKDVAARAKELGIRSVLTTEVINWAGSAVKEFDLARRLVYHAVREKVLPKRLEPNLVLLRDPKLYEHRLDDRLPGRGVRRPAEPCRRGGPDQRHHRLLRTRAGDRPPLGQHPRRDAAVGAAVRRLREERGFTRRELAQHSGRDKAQLAADNVLPTEGAIFITVGTMSTLPAGTSLTTPLRTS